MTDWLEKNDRPFHCNDKNNVSIHATASELRCLTKFGRSIDSKDTLKGAMNPYEVDKPAGQLKCQIMLRSYQTELTKRVTKEGIKVVMFRDVERVLKRCGYDLERSVILLGDIYRALKKCDFDLEQSVEVLKRDGYRDLKTWELKRFKMSSATIVRKYELRALNALKDNV